MWKATGTNVDWHDHQCQSQMCKFLHTINHDVFRCPADSLPLGGMIPVKTSAASWAFFCFFFVFVGPQRFLHSSTVKTGLEAKHHCAKNKIIVCVCVCADRSFLAKTLILWGPVALMLKNIILILRFGFMGKV